MNTEHLETPQTMIGGGVRQNASGSQGSRRRMGRQSAILAMPKHLYHASQLFTTSAITKFQTFEVESTDSGEEYLMKTLKNEQCVAIKAKQEMRRTRELDHFALPDVVYTDFSENYSYVVYKKPKGKPLWKHGQTKQYPERIVRNVAYQLARCLQYTHSLGIIHRDLRAANVIGYFSPKEPSRPHITLCDFRASKLLRPDEKLAILEDGSSYPSAHVNQKLGQYPAPEVLMDLKIDRAVDSWFLGLFMYLLISGSVPFNGTTDSEIKEDILYHSIQFNDDAWLSVSAQLDEIITGLLTKNPKKRWTVDRLLWNKWIHKISYTQLLHYVLAYWLRNCECTLNYDSMLLCMSYVQSGIHVCQYDIDLKPVLALNWKEETQDLKTKKQKKRIHKFVDDQILSKHGDYLVSYNNAGSTVMHQSKIRKFAHSDSRSDHSISSFQCITCACNVWVSPGSSPYTFEFTFDYIKDDVFIGFISDDYLQDLSSPSLSTNHAFHLGLNNTTLGISLRECVAYYDSKQIASLNPNRTLGRASALPIPASHQIAMASFENKSSNRTNTSSGTTNDSDNNDDDDIFSFEYEKNTHSGMHHISRNDPHSYYNLKVANASVHSKNPHILQRSYQNLSVKMRIDYVSRTISLCVNGQVLNPLYFEFKGKVTAAVTLCNCFDQITLEKVLIDRL